MSESNSLIKTIEQELAFLCRKANPESFKSFTVHNLRSGSVIADGVAQYNYPNNDSQIEFLNMCLQSTLQSIFNETDSLKKLSQALGYVDIRDTEIIMQFSQIRNLSDLKPFLTCSMEFSNYTLEISKGSWRCMGPCKKDPNYCHQHGQCFNKMEGPVCQCFDTYLEEYYGKQCEFYRKKAGFYAVLFGSLAAILLLFTIIATVIIVLWRHHRMEG
ncbi:mucin-4 [Denticeps clupeoides]|uniref:mucin-4 n=1 Tax=Denticeps clupeoides TaxID=299321 RepID=UPI0010A31233|nr:mucin-4-like [Denticeps clupeoides]